MQHCVCCGRKKLPFAEYSVVKDQIGELRPPNPPLAHSAGTLKVPLRSLAGEVGPLSDLFRNTEVAKLITSVVDRCATKTQRSRSRPTSVRERPKGLITHRNFSKTWSKRCGRGRALCAPRYSGLPPPFRLRRTAFAGLPTVAPQGVKAGGEYRARTGDLLVANQALSQLS